MGIGYRFAFNLDYAHVHSRDLILETHRVHQKQEQIGVRNRHQTLTIGLSYWALDQLNATLRIPFVENQRTKRAAGVKYEGRGLSDIALDLQYWLATPAADRWNVYGLIGVTMPTGDDDTPSGQSEPTKPYIQPGSGVWTPALGAGLRRSWGALTWLADTSFAWPLGESDAEYDPANAWYLSTGVAYLFQFGTGAPPVATTEGAAAPAIGTGPWISVSLTVNNLYVQSKGYDHDKPVGNSGGWWVRLEPRIEASPDGSGFSVYFAMPFPVYAEVNSLQCIEDYGINFGASYRF